MSRKIRDLIQASTGEWWNSGEYGEGSGQVPKNGGIQASTEEGSERVPEKGSGKYRKSSGRVSEKGPGEYRRRFRASTEKAPGEYRRRVRASTKKW